MGGLRRSDALRGGTASPRIPGTGSILVVDDNEINRDLLSRRLSREGHTVAVACDGRQALDMVRAQQFDLILLDIIMPGLNGFQVLEQLKAEQNRRSAAMAKELARHKVTHELVTVTGAGHGLSGGDRKAVAEANEKALAFIRRHLKE